MNPEGKYKLQIVKGTKHTKIFLQLMTTYLLFIINWPPPAVPAGRYVYVVRILIILALLAIS